MNFVIFQTGDIIKLCLCLTNLSLYRVSWFLNSVIPPLKYFYPSPFKGPPPKKHVLSPPPFSNFLGQKFLFLDLLISFIKSFKTSDLSIQVDWGHNIRFVIKTCTKRMFSKEDIV